MNDREPEVWEVADWEDAELAIRKKAKEPDRAEKWLARNDPNYVPGSYS